MAVEVTLIPANPRINRGNLVLASHILRVAAYCRVSTNNEDQLSSFDNQVQYYTEHIERNPNYAMAGIYADEGITGTSVRRRDQFKKMIEDCEAGKIDLIITKSISRFARNTRDCLEYSRKLKNLGIGIYFEKENINTLDTSGELLFTILSSLAQEESRSTSENCKWGIRTKFKQGIYHINTNRFLGYDKDSDGLLIINKAQALIVRRIYYEFMWGLNPDTISKRLNDEGVPGCMGQPRWTAGTIVRILENEKYKGEALLQKYFTVDFLDKKTVKNEGQLEQIWVKNSHPAIIPSELWETVQLELKRRKLYMEKHGLRTLGRYTDEQPFSCKVVCGNCKNVYWRRTLTRSNGKFKVWQCGKRYRTKGVIECENRYNLYESDLEKAFMTGWNSIIRSRESFIEYWKKQIKEGDALTKWRAEQMLEITAQPPLTKICPELVNMVLDHIEVYKTGELKFFLLDGTEFETEL